ncbi:hypothetical protein OG558_39230 [Kribbella sp. NBC_01510]|uniref:hypothetical protein n=1 Tax=Kribbella sp. NBC_01510 TaxID=2903581 RepID=UPI00386E8121
MTTTLQQEIDRWEADLETIAANSASDSWFLEERRFAEAQHTIMAFRGHILPLVAHQQPQDAVVSHEIEHLVDRLEDLRNDLYRTVHPPTSHEEIAETVAALRALSRTALRDGRSLEDVR